MFKISLIHRVNWHISLYLGSRILKYHYSQSIPTSQGMNFTHRGPNTMATVLQQTFANQSSWFKFHCNAFPRVQLTINQSDSKVRGANIGPTWGQEDPGGPIVDPMNLAIWAVLVQITAWHRTGDKSLSKPLSKPLYVTRRQWVNWIFRDDNLPYITNNMDFFRTMSCSGLLVNGLIDIVKSHFTDPNA